jgi:hypothetical protein
MSVPYVGSMVSPEEGKVPMIDSAGCHIHRVLSVLAMIEREGGLRREVRPLCRAGVEGRPEDRRTAQVVLRWLQVNAAGLLGELVRGGGIVPWENLGTVIDGWAEVRKSGFTRFAS